MFSPPQFREDRTEILHGLVRAHPFATLISANPGGMEANHLPFFLDVGKDAELGVLKGHVARPNPVWEKADRASEVLVIFQGPHHYVTPTWYPSKAEHGKVVPTWNYMIVHARGTMRIVHDADWLKSQLNALTDQQEGGRETPWAVDDAPADFTEKMIAGIVGLEIPIGSLEGKWKLSQNRNMEDRAGVARGLSEEKNENARAVARSMPD